MDSKTSEGGEEQKNEKKNTTGRRESEAEKTKRMEDEKQQKLQKLKKQKADEEKKMNRLKKELWKKQCERTKKELEGSPLMVDQVKIYDKAVRRVEKEEGLVSPHRSPRKRSPSKKHDE